MLWKWVLLRTAENEPSKACHNGLTPYYYRQASIQLFFRFNWYSISMHHYTVVTSYHQKPAGPNDNRLTDYVEINFCNDCHRMTRSGRLERCREHMFRISTRWCFLCYLSFLETCILFLTKCMLSSLEQWRSLFFCTVEMDPGCTLDPPFFTCFFLTKTSFSLLWRSPPAVATAMHQRKTVGLTFFRAICSVPDFGIRRSPFFSGFLPVFFFELQIHNSHHQIFEFSWSLKRDFQLILEWFSESRDGISCTFR